MHVFQPALSWVRGEIFEAAIIVVWGLTIMLAGYLFWKHGVTPNARSLFLPLLLTGLIYTSIGGAMLFQNQNRLRRFETAYNENPAGFLRAEKNRVLAFQYGYTISKIVASLFFPLCVFIFWFSKNSLFQGIGLGLAIFAVTGLVIDYFSQERADIYFKAITEAQVIKK